MLKRFFSGRSLVWQGSCFIVGAIFWAYLGLDTMFEFGHAPEIVGGDASYYILIANIGIGIVCVEILSSVIGGALLLAGILVALKEEVGGKG